MKNIRLLTVITALMLAAATLLASCSGKKDNANDKEKDERPPKEDIIWNNIGDFSTKSEEILKIDAIDGFDKLVAGCYDNSRYYYFILENDAGEDIICKYDSKDDKMHRVSDPFYINGAGGMCIRSDRIIILHKSNRVSYFDNSSFENMTGTSLLFKSTSIAYNKKLDNLILCQEDGTLNLVDRQHELVGTIPSINQIPANAVACDNNYVYTLTAGINGSEIIVYTLGGDYVCNSMISDVKLAPVGMFFKNSEFYVFYDTDDGGGVLYKTVFESQS